MARLLGFFDDFGYPRAVATGSLGAQVRAVGEPDEAEIVEYLDTGHRLTAFMEASPDVRTGHVHRHTSGGSSLVTDGTWVWRADFAHYLETCHVPLPAAFLDRVRILGHRMPDLIGADFAPVYDDLLRTFGWTTSPWDQDSVLRPQPRVVRTRAEFVAEVRRQRPQGPWSRRPRKPRPENQR